MFPTLIILLLLTWTRCSCMNVLVSIPTAVQSETFLVYDLAYALATKGHQITIITAFNPKAQHENITLIWIPELEHIPVESNVNYFEFNSFASRYDGTGRYYHYLNMVTWNDNRVMGVWRKRNDFDIFLTVSLYAEGTFPFLMGTTTPFVQIVTPGYETEALSREENWVTPAVMSSLQVSLCDRMDFWERSYNLFSTLQFYYYQRKTIDVYTEPVTKVFPDIGDYLSYYDRVALTLINGHFALDGPVPLLPSQIEIGTINAKKARPLEQVDMRIAEFVNGSGDAGIVYFSLGSIAKGTDIPKEAKDVFVEAFRRIPQRVLWKYEIDDLDLPPNVMTSNWMPQQDILGHPKTRVFISHCGNLGTQEAKYHGVPVLGLPIAFDQPRNAARMERKGYALVIRWEELTVDLFLEKLNIIINDKTYHERLKNLSRILQDQKDTPLERAIWWLEYVVRHNGAPHLNYAGRRLSLFQYIMLDVLLFWFGAMAAFVLVVVCAFRVICCRKKGQPVKETKKLEKKKKQ